MEWLDPGFLEDFICYDHLPTLFLSMGVILLLYHNIYGRSKIQSIPKYMTRIFSCKSTIFGTHIIMALKTLPALETSKL